MPGEKPGVAFILSLIGGIFVLLGGILRTVIGAAVTIVVGGMGGIVGVIGIVWGILIIIFATRLNSDPGSHSTSGALIIVFSVLSWIGAIGGLFIGFLLGLIGGILAVTWKPQAQAPMQQVAPAPAVQPGMKYCANCGTQMVSYVGFCPKCGAKQL